MMMRVALRGVAVLIAIMGMVDPAVILARRVRQPLVIAVDGALQPALTSAARLQELLSEDYDIRLRRVDDMRGLSPDLSAIAHRAEAEARSAKRGPACAPGESCVLIGGDRWSSSRALRAARVVGAVRVAEEAGPWITIASATIPTPTHASAIGQLRVEITGHGVTGQESTLDVFDGGVPIGRATHAWKADGRVTIPIDWWPLGAGLRRLSVRATRDGLENRGIDDQVDVGAHVGSEPYNVLVYDTRPSWTSTFVRRAIERDARLALRVAARLGPRLEVTTGEPFRLADATLTNASAVVIGAPDGLSEQDVDALERFVRIRGGSLILAPDRRPTGPITRLLHGSAGRLRQGSAEPSISSSMVERLEPAPIRVGDWRASELLVFRDPRPGSSILAKANADAVVIVSPLGTGRIVVSGAMDAWRYRDADGAAFDRAWLTLVADAASAGGRTLEVTLDRSVVRPAEEVHVTARLRSMASADAATSVSATIACGDQPARMLRLWPTGERRRFEGRFATTVTGPCRVAVSSSAPSVSSESVDVLVANDVRGVSGADANHDATLDEIARAVGAPVIVAGDETTLARDVRRLVPAELAPSRVRPMRSPWWIVPFAGCLGVEWWLRRRHGLR